MDEKIKVIDLWIAQKEVDKAMEKLREAQQKLNDLVESASTDELVLLMDDFYEREKKNVETYVPDLVVKVIHQLVDREEKEEEATE
jgi:hypothetical protein